MAKHAGIPLKIAGDIQPMHREYFEAKIRPHIDGKFIDYVGLADLEAKNELLGNSMAMLFPIKWDEPFGLVMVEAMACGTPVVSLPGGSVPEIVHDEISGYVCNSVPEMAKRVKSIQISPRALRQYYVEENFSLDRMVTEYASYMRTLGPGFTRARSPWFSQFQRGCLEQGTTAEENLNRASLRSAPPRCVCGSPNVFK